MFQQSTCIEWFASFSTVYLLQPKSYFPHLSKLILSRNSLTSQSTCIVGWKRPQNFNWCVLCFSNHCASVVVSSISVFVRWYDLLRNTHIEVTLEFLNRSGTPPLGCLVKSQPPIVRTMSDCVCQAYFDTVSFYII